MKILFSLCIYSILFLAPVHALNTQTLPVLNAVAVLGVEREKESKNPLRDDGFMDVLQGSVRTSLDAPLEIPEKDEISVYVVRDGDTIPSIAKLFNVSPNTIIWANDLRKKSIKTGDILVILPMNGVRHIVKKGDTLKKIAGMYKADVGDIGLFNGLTEESELRVGDTIIVPEGEITEIEPKKEVKKVVPPKVTRPQVVSRPSGVQSSYYIRPIVGVRTQGIHGRNAVDIGAPVGTPVRASAEGTVILARSEGWNGGYGNYVIIQHPNGTQTLYAHLSVIYVNPGQFVVQGQTIAGSGNSGRSTGPHLHFEIRNGPRNPF